MKWGAAEVRALALLVCTTSVSNLQGQNGESQPAEPWQVQGIRAALNDPIPSVRLFALQRASLFSRVSGISSLEIVPFLRDSDPVVREAAVSALGTLEGQDPVPEVVKQLRDSDLSVQVAAISALGKLGAREEAGELVKLIRVSDFRVRGAAIRALAKLGARDQVPEIVKLLKDDDPAVRVIAAELLGEMGAKESAPEVAKLLKDDDSHPSGSPASPG